VGGIHVGHHAGPDRTTRFGLAARSAIQRDFPSLEPWAHGYWFVGNHLALRVGSQESVMTSMQAICSAENRCAVANGETAKFWPEANYRATYK
jgi:hypothetical protein